MIRWEKVPRASFFEGWTRGFFLGLTVFVTAVSAAYFFAPANGPDLTPCAMRQILGIPCPLCGGTTSSFALLSGQFAKAFLTNPLVSLALPLAALWAVSWLGFGYRFSVSLPLPFALPAILLLVLSNWAYVISTRMQ